MGGVVVFHLAVVSVNASFLLPCNVRLRFAVVKMRYKHDSTVRSMQNCHLYGDWMCCVRNLHTTTCCFAKATAKYGNTN